MQELIISLTGLSVTEKVKPMNDIYSVKKVTIPTIVHIFQELNAYLSKLRLIYVGKTPRNKMLRKMLLHNYPRKSYLTIFDSIKLDRGSLLRICRNKFNVVQKSP